MESLDNQTPVSTAPVQNTDSSPTPINPVPMTTNPLGVPGFSLDAKLADRLNQSAQVGRHLNVKLITIIALIGLLLGGGAYAWFFTNLKYKLPWFKPAEDKLVGMMYENLAKLDGADFAVTYKLSVGDRDADVKKVDEKKVSDREARSRKSYVMSALSNLSSAVIICFDNNSNIQVSSGQICDGSDKAQPKADENICPQQDGYSNTSFKSYGEYIWPDISQYEWEYDKTCQSHYDVNTWVFSAHSTYNDDKITCTEKGCVWNNADLADLDTSSEFDFLLGEYLTEFDNYISTNFNLQATFAGSGFSLKERDKDQKQLPNVEMSLNGSADLGSFSGKVQLAAKVIEDFIYYKVDAFPFIDITQGHEGEWIKAGLEDNDSSEIGYMLGDLTPEMSNAQNEAIKKFRDFIAQSKDYSVLEFKATGNYLENHGVKSPIFEVKIVPENVPNWLEALKKIYDESATSSGGGRLLDLTESNPAFVEIPPTEPKSEALSDKEKTKIIEQVKKINENLKINAALHPGTGDLMNLTLNFRIIPPPEAKKFVTKQFNSSLIIDMWNHNNPTETKVPDKFIEQDEIEREKLGLSQEAYQDIKQAKRIESIRIDLAKYYGINRKFPDKLSEATKLVTDYSTDKDYDYKISGNNYSLSYAMNDVEQKPRPKNNYSYYGDYYVKDGFYNNLTSTKDHWDKGINIADRYSAVSQKYQTSQALLVDDKTHFDKDVLVAVLQAGLIANTRDTLKNYYNKNKKYPTNFDEIWADKSYLGYSYYNSDAYYVGENLVSAKVADYQLLNDGADYSIKFDFPLDVKNISSSIVNQKKNILLDFRSGANEFNKTTIYNTLYKLDNNSSSYNFSNEIFGTNGIENLYTYTIDLVDTDKDGLGDDNEVLLGTDPKKIDSDGDTYSDYTEYYGGYNPLGKGTALNGSWSACVSLDKFDNCTAYCKSINKICSNNGITSRGYASYGAEAWSNSNSCKTEPKGGKGQQDCDAKDDNGGARWKCFCK